MKTTEEIKNWILQNCVNRNGDIDISSLDFSDFEGDILRGKWKVKGNLWQHSSEVKGKTYNDFDNHNKVMKFVAGQGWVEDERFARQLEDMTKEELIEKIREMEVK